MRSNIQRTAQFLGINFHDALQFLPVSAERQETRDEGTLLKIQIPSEHLENKRAWNEEFCKKWDKLKLLVSASQPVKFDSHYQYEHAMWKQARGYATCPPLHEIAATFSLPPATISKKNEVFIYCASKDELSLVAALGVRFPRSELLAQGFYAKHRITPDLQQIAGL